MKVQKAEEEWQQIKSEKKEASKRRQEALHQEGPMPQQQAQ
jgi:hypothetical protein